MNMRSLLSVALLSSFCGGVFGAALVYEFFLHRTLDVVRAHQIQIEDAHGTLKATLAAESSGSTYLRFLAPDNREAILLGEQMQNARGNAEVAPAPIFEFNQGGQTALRISADSSNNGVIAFSDRQRENTMLLGYFPFPADLTTAEPRYEWGLHIRREHGETGIGIVDSPGLPVDYISPVPHTKP